VAPYVLTVAGVASWWWSLRSIHPYRASALGLLPQLSFLWWLGLLLTAGAVVWELRRDVPRWPGMVVSLAALALVLHGTLPAVEAVPRFSTAYSVAGFSEYLGRTGRALPRLDVRMSWPAMFAAAGMAARAMGVSTLWFLRWCPLVLNLAYLVPLKAIANTCLRTERARWAVLGLFLAANWIDQDYFSPQGLNLFLFLVAVAVVIRIFSAGGYPPRLIAWIVRTRQWAAVQRAGLRIGKLPHGAVAGEQPDLATTPRRRVAMLVVLLVVLGASAVSHQITPAALCLVLFGLAVTGRTGLRLLWLLMACLVWAWLSWEGHAYWSDHLAKVFGSAGNVGSTLSATVTARLQGSTPERTFVQGGRVLAAAIVWLGALGGFVALWRRGRTLWTMVIVAVFPVAVAGAVSYGGEVALRLLLFSLAPAAVLIASLVDHRVPGRAAVTVCLALAAALLILFPLVRFGNESFEAISPDDLAAATWIHAHVATGADIYIANRDEPLEYTAVGSYRLVQVGGLVALRGPELTAHLPVTHVPTYVYLTRSQDNYGVDFLGYRTGWMSDFIDQLLKTGDVHVVFRNSTAIVLRIEKHPPAKQPRTDQHPHAPSHTPPAAPKPAPKPKPVPVPRPKPVPIVRPKPVPTTRPKSTTTTRPKSTTTTTTTTTPTTTTTTTTTPSTTTTTTGSGP
jgi:hypothetical protein